MNLGNIIMEVISKKSQDESTTYQLQEINSEIDRFDFAIAAAMADPNKWDFFAMIQANAKKLEAAYKGYILGVVKDDKELRLDSLKHLKHLMQGIVPHMKEFKQHWNEHKNCGKDKLNCNHHKE